LEEVGGDAANYFDPLDPKDIARASMELLNDPEFCASQIEKGYERAKLFTWSQTVIKTNDLYLSFLNK
jgi:glycosyltransferase involved in cell wall biosynthesis